MWLIYTLTAKITVLYKPYHQINGNNLPVYIKNKYTQHTKPGYQCTLLYTYKKLPSNPYYSINIYNLNKTYIINKYTSPQHHFKIVQFITQIVRKLLSSAGEYYCYSVHHSRTSNTNTPDMNF